jgi:hypothetical protein
VFKKAIVKGVMGWVVRSHPSSQPFKQQRRGHPPEPEAAGRKRKQTQPLVATQRGIDAGFIAGAGEWKNGKMEKRKNF